jgi:DNA-binding response OmpR family regulator
MRVAIVEDDPDSSLMMGRLFLQDGASAEVFHNGRQFLRHASYEKFDVAILDLRLPDMSGIQVLERLKTIALASSQQLPVMVVTGCAEAAVMETAFAHGAADYISKPFKPAELLIRAKALAKRAYPENHSQAPIVIGGAYLNLSTREFRFNDREIRLSDKEFRLAWLLFRRHGQTVSRSLMLRSVWGRADSNTVSRSLDTHIGRLRKKIASLPESGLKIAGVYGIGYRMDFFS